MRSLNFSRFSKSITLLIGVGFIAMLLMGSSGCDSSQSDQQRNQAIKERSTAFSRAERIAPTPKTVNFPLRKALVEFTERQDLVDHPWYIYILGMNGNIIGYYVGKTVPINTCDFLSSTQDVYSDSLALQAPSLDGIYYGGSGSSSGCDAWFFFDSTTNALIQIRGIGFYAADQPLRVEAKPIRVAR